MTDKKLTDADIVKALECCNNCDCGGCPCLTEDGCKDIDYAEILDLINRQAENERLKGHQKDGFFNLLGNCLVFSKTLKDYNDMRKGLKSEAYKEFAERLQDRCIKQQGCLYASDIGAELNELVGEGK